MQYHFHHPLHLYHRHLRHSLVVRPLLHQQMYRDRALPREYVGHRRFQEVLDMAHQEHLQSQEASHQIQMMMKDAERAVFTGGSVTWKKSQDSISLDSKALLKQHPEYLQQFPQTKVGTRRFQIYPNGG